MVDTFLKREVTTTSPKETQELAADLLENPKGRNIFALIGDLGSGKTTFSQGIGRALGIKRHLQSPTFTIIKQYKISSKDFPFKELYHIDLYRLEDNVDTSQLGLEEIMSDPENLVIIEWAEKMKKDLPEDRIDIAFEYVDDGIRKITFQKHGKDQKSDIKT